MTGKRVPARTPYKKGQAQKYTRKKREASFEEDDERPVAKKAKGKAAAVDSDEEDGVGAPAVLDTSKHKDKNGDTYWNLNAKGTRRLTISSFKNNILVHIREFWTNEAGDMLPGKKGIALNQEQWEQLVKLVPQIQGALGGGDGKEEAVEAEEQEEKEKKGADTAEEDDEGDES